jgi:predicted permease
MSNFILLTICFSLGIVFRLSKKFPENTPQVLNAFVLNVSLPALVLLHVHNIQISADIFLPALMPWIVFLFSFLLLYILYILKRIDDKTFICLALTSGLGNTSFVGIPLLQSYLGNGAIGYAIISDQLGTFLVLSFPGLILANLAEKGTWDIKFLIRRVFTFTPVIALYLAILFRLFAYPEWLELVLQRLGDTLSPLALVSVGFLLNLRTLKGHKLLLLLGLSIKLILAPTIIILIYCSITPNRLMFETIVLEAAMAPMVTSTIVAIDRNLAPHLASLMLGVGIPFSFLTTYCFLLLLKSGYI